MDANKRNHYQLLGLEKGATLEEIKQAFKDIALVYHPDSNFFDEIISGTESTLPLEDMKKFQEISHAYSILSNENKRLAYDSELTKKEFASGRSSTEEWLRPDGTTPQEAKKVRERAPTITNLQKFQKQYEENVRSNSKDKKTKTLQTFADLKNKRQGQEDSTNKTILIIMGVIILIIIITLVILI